LQGEACKDQAVDLPLVPQVLRVRQAAQNICISSTNELQT
jgi:hypothetical protein